MNSSLAVTGLDTRAAQLASTHFWDSRRAEMRCLSAATNQANRAPRELRTRLKLSMISRIADGIAPDFGLYRRVRCAILRNYRRYSVNPSHHRHRRCVLGTASRSSPRPQ